MRTKQDYELAGFRAGKMGTAASEMKPGWQRTAFVAGYERGRTHLERSRKVAEGAHGLSDSRDIQNMPKPVTRWVATGQAQHDAATGDTSAKRSPHWREDITGLKQVDVQDLYRIMQAVVAPHCAREHVKILGAQHNEEHDLKRRARLHRSIGRTLCRWVDRYPTRDFAHVLGAPMKQPGTGESL